MPRDDRKYIYRVHFHNDGEIYDVYVSDVSDSFLSGFIRLEGFIFGENSQVVIDPSEEKLRSEFEDVDFVEIPFHHVLRISSVKKRGSPKIVKSDQSSVSVIPFSIPAERKK